MTLDEAKAAIEKRLLDMGLKRPVADVTLAQSKGLQQIRGEHLVRPDGTVGLGTYGKVYVTGLTIPQAKRKIDEHLTKYMFNPDVSVDILSYNSKVFYVITDGAGLGQQLHRVPITGNETVLDAMSNLGAISPTTSVRRIWIARPAPPNSPGGDQILRVDWVAVTKAARTETNYQLLPGDRLYLDAAPLVTFNNMFTRVITPFEQLFGVAILGVNAVELFRSPSSVLGNGTGTGTGFGGVGGF
jgi:hypothetical protein